MTVLRGEVKDDLFLADHFQEIYHQKNMQDHMAQFSTRNGSLFLKRIG